MNNHLQNMTSRLEVTSLRSRDTQMILNILLSYSKQLTKVRIVLELLINLTYLLVNVFYGGLYTLE